MDRTRSLIVPLLLVAAMLAADRPQPLSQTELDSISARGHLLYEADQAGWHSSDAVQSLKPPQDSVSKYIEKKTPTGWTVAFGRFSETHDKFLVAYEAIAGANPREYTVRKYTPPREDADYYFHAATAKATVQQDVRGENRPYNIAVIPAPDGQFYVYVLPAQTQNDVYPLGGDFRYLVSADGTKIVEKRQMHKTILEQRSEPNTVAGTHSHVLSDVPEDSDVFHVLTRKPALPEYVGTENFIYCVNADGSIRFLQRTNNRKKK